PDSRAKHPCFACRGPQSPVRGSPRLVQRCFGEQVSPSRATAWERGSVFGLPFVIAERSFWHDSIGAPSIRFGRLPPLLADQRFLARIVDGVAHAVDVRGRLVVLEFAGQLAVGPKFASLEQRPHLLAIP